MKMSPESDNDATTSTAPGVKDVTDGQIYGSIESTASCSSSSDVGPRPMPGSWQQSDMRPAEDGERSSVGRSHGQAQLFTHPRLGEPSPQGSKGDTNNSSVSSAAFPLHLPLAIGLPVHQTGGMPLPDDANNRGCQAGEGNKSTSSLADLKNELCKDGYVPPRRWNDGAFAGNGSGDTETENLHSGATLLNGDLTLGPGDTAKSGHASHKGTTVERRMPEILQDASSSEDKGLTEGDSNHTNTNTNHKGNEGKADRTTTTSARKRVLRAASQPLLVSTITPQRLNRSKSSDELSTTLHVSTAFMTSSTPSKSTIAAAEPATLQRETTMTERLKKLRNSVSNRPVRLKKKMNRSNSDIPRTMSKRDLFGGEDDTVPVNFNGGGEKNVDEHSREQSNYPKDLPQLKARSLSSSPISKLGQSGLKSSGLEKSIIHSRKTSLPTTGLRRASTTSLVGSNPRSTQRRSSTGDMEWGFVDEEDAGDDVLMLIAKARAKLAMQGLGADEAAKAEAETVLSQINHQRERAGREQRKGESRATTGSTIPSGGGRSPSSSQGGAASLPGAYEKVPGGGFERKEAFAHASITRHSLSAQMRQGHSSQQQFHSSFSDLGSITSGNSVAMSDIMEIEFSQQSLSNHDEGDGVDTKKAASRRDVETDQYSSISFGTSAATLSLNRDEIFSQEEKPAKRRSKGIPRRSRSVKSGADASKAANTEDEDSIPASVSAAFASAPTLAMYDDDSDVSSTDRRRLSSGTRSSGRGRFTQASHTRRRSYDIHLERDKEAKSSTGMKDESGGSANSQLVVAAEVVRSEEEMVDELRHKVKKEILESMAKELNEMEASMTAFSSDFMDMSQTISFDMSQPTLDYGTSTTLTNWQSQGQQPACERKLEPPSPMSASLPAVRTRRMTDFSSKPSPVTKTKTPKQPRRLRSLNLSGVSPRFLRTGRIPGRSSSTPWTSSSTKFPKALVGLPQLQTSLSVGAKGNRESSSSDDEQSIEIVDALDVRTEPPLQMASLSQQVMHNRRQTPTNTLNEALLRPGSLLDQLRSMTNAGSTALAPLFDVPAPVECATTHNAIRPISGDSNISCLPDVATPEPLVVESITQGSSNRNHPHPEPTKLEPSSQPPLSAHLDTPVAPSVVHSSIELLPIGSVDDPRTLSVNQFQGLRQDEAEYHVIDTLERCQSHTTNIPSDWEIEQLEMAELAEHAASLSRLRRGLGVAVIESNPLDIEMGQEQQSLMLITDNELPVAWATPVCILVMGAVILAVVLFAV